VVIISIIWRSSHLLQSSTHHSSRGKFVYLTLWWNGDVVLQSFQPGLRRCVYII
jgi:hypothetical protein